MWNFLGFLRKPSNNTPQARESVSSEFQEGHRSSFVNGGGTVAAGVISSSRAIEINSDPAATYRELVKTMYRDTIRITGLPKDWLNCELLTLADGGRARFHIQFVIRHWDQELLDYLPAFQKSFTDRVQRFSPALIERIHSISWRFSSRAGCPILTMPPADHWSETSRKARALAEEQEKIQALLNQGSRTQKMDFQGGFQDTRPMTGAEFQKRG